VFTLRLPTEAADAPESDARADPVGADSLWVHP
jgi:hypothetical protein